ncbi:hypothetical protein ACIQWL_53680 [Streptomyces mirabilis]|uniref:hypothetical protein n=1 Tax=Streptomyces mirabilis TaxID=68239 RepID=UPI00225B8261|nr:hypothetical protein [Streptomyces mirabilis]MCX4428847.1 hypothetical protein [Streptomyces mirabilis]
MSHHVIEAARAVTWTNARRPGDWTPVERHGLRPWIEQSYKQIKDELGWTDFQVFQVRAHGTRTYGQSVMYIQAESVLQGGTDTYRYAWAH